MLVIVVVHNLKLKLFAGFAVLHVGPVPGAERGVPHPHALQHAPRRVRLLCHAQRHLPPNGN